MDKASISIPNNDIDLSCTVGTVCGVMQQSLEYTCFISVFGESTGAVTQVRVKARAVNVSLRVPPLHLVSVNTWCPPNQYTISYSPPGIYRYLHTGKPDYRFSPKNFEKLYYYLHYSDHEKNIFSFKKYF